MKDRTHPIKRTFLFTMVLLAILVHVLVFFNCGGGFNQDSENAQEFINPLFNNRKFISDTTSDTSHKLKLE